jgi:hypothetical protein
MVNSLNLEYESLKKQLLNKTTTTTTSTMTTMTTGDLERASLKRSSLKNFKNWRPFNEPAKIEAKSITKDEYLLEPRNRGLVKRMASSFISNQITKHDSPPVLVRPTATRNSTPTTRIKVSSDASSSKKDSCVFTRNRDTPTAITTGVVSNSLQFRGNFQVEETENGIKIKLKQPHLISVTVNNNPNTTQPIMAAAKTGGDVVLNKKKPGQLLDCNSSEVGGGKVNKTSIKIYPLKIGRTTIGSCANNDVVINSPGIEPQHCFIENNQLVLHENAYNPKSSLTQTCGFVTLYPIGMCAVDGVLIDTPFMLTTGWYLI